MRNMLFGVFVVTVMLALPGCRQEFSEQRPPIEGAFREGNWIRTELFFGMARPNGQAISDTEWDDYLDKSVTPRFPGGLTVIRANGRYKTKDGELRKEATAVLVLLRPRQTDVDDHSKIEAMTREFVVRFDQESVLWTDSQADAIFIGSSTMKPPLKTSR